MSFSVTDKWFIRVSNVQPLWLNFCWALSHKGFLKSQGQRWHILPFTKLKGQPLRNKSTFAQLITVRAFPSTVTVTETVAAMLRQRGANVARSCMASEGSLKKGAWTFLTVYFQNVASSDHFFQVLLLCLSRYDKDCTKVMLKWNQY